jgi:hypothetical protein
MILIFFVVDLIVLMLVQFQTVHASTPIMFDSSGTDDCVQVIYPSDCSTLSWSHSVGSGSNAILIVALAHLNGPDATTVTFGGRSLSFIGDADNNGNLDVELWSLLDPPSGKGMVTASFSSGAEYLTGGSISYFNVAGTRTPASASVYDKRSVSVNVASSPYDLVVDSLCLCGGYDPGPVSPSSPQTDWFDSGTLVYDDSWYFVGAGSDKPASSPTTSMTWDWPTSTYGAALVAVSLIPAAATPPIPEYPLGLPILAIFMALGYVVIKRRTLRYPDSSSLLQLVTRSTSNVT